MKNFQEKPNEPVVQFVDDGDLPDDECCMAQPVHRGLVCTRRKGHTEQHEAWAHWHGARDDELCAVWEDDDSSERLDVTAYKYHTVCKNCGKTLGGHHEWDCFNYESKYDGPLELRDGAAHPLTSSLDRPQAVHLRA